MSVITRREEIARALGEDPRRLRELKASIVDRLVREGVLVRVHVGRWRATHRLSPQDLGLDPEAARHLLQQIDLGSKLLLPRRVLADLDRLESRGRANLVRHSLDTALGPFMPATAFRPFKEAHEAARSQYFAIRDDILVRLPELRGQVAAAFRQAARDLWPTVQARTDATQDAFTQEYVERAMRLYPAADAIARSFRFDYEVHYIPLSSELLAEEVRRAELLRDQELRGEVARHLAERRKGEIDAFLGGIVQQLRAIVHEMVSAALASLRRHGTPPPKTVAALRHLIERVGMLNVHGDADIATRLRDLEALLGPPQRGRAPIPVARLEQALVDLRETCQEAVTDAFRVEPLLTRFYAIDLTPDELEPARGVRA